jgi:hypothetical protein
MILGANWLATYSPNYTDWDNRSISITVDGKWCTLTDTHTQPVNCVISAKACSKLLSQGAQAYLIQIQSPEPTAMDETGSPELNVEVLDILHQYNDVFQEPTALPPERTCDHTIPLQNGSQPPNVRPYRMPHKQKNLVEELVTKMLKTSEIRPSNSPYSSPAILVRKKDKS